MADMDVEFFEDEGEYEPQYDEEFVQNQEAGAQGDEWVVPTAEDYPTFDEIGLTDSAIGIVQEFVFQNGHMRLMAADVADAMRDDEGNEHPDSIQFARMVMDVWRMRNPTLEVFEEEFAEGVEPEAQEEYAGAQEEYAGAQEEYAEAQEEYAEYVEQFAEDVQYVQPTNFDEPQEEYEPPPQMFVPPPKRPPPPPKPASPSYSSSSSSSSSSSTSSAERDRQKVNQELANIQAKMKKDGKSKDQLKVEQELAKIHFKMEKLTAPKPGKSKDQLKVEHELEKLKSKMVKMVARKPADEEKKKVEQELKKIERELQKVKAAPAPARKPSGPKVWDIHPPHPEDFPALGDMVEFASKLVQNYAVANGDLLLTPSQLAEAIKDAKGDQPPWAGALAVATQVLAVWAKHNPLLETPTPSTKELTVMRDKSRPYAPTEGQIVITVPLEEEYPKEPHPMEGHNLVGQTVRIVREFVMRTNTLAITVDEVARQIDARCGDNWSEKRDMAEGVLMAWRRRNGHLPSHAVIARENGKLQLLPEPPADQNKPPADQAKPPADQAKPKAAPHALPKAPSHDVPKSHSHDRQSSLVSADLGSRTGSHQSHPPPPTLPPSVRAPHPATMELPGGATLYFPLESEYPSFDRSGLTDDAIRLVSEFVAETGSLGLTEELLAAQMVDFNGNKSPESRDIAKMVLGVWRMRNPTLPLIAVNDIYNGHASPHKPSHPPTSHPHTSHTLISHHDTPHQHTSHPHPSYPHSSHPHTPHPPTYHQDTSHSHTSHPAHPSHPMPQPPPSYGSVLQITGPPPAAPPATAPAGALQEIPPIPPPAPEDHAHDTRYGSHSQYVHAERPDSRDDAYGPELQQVLWPLGCGVEAFFSGLFGPGLRITHLSSDSLLYKSGVESGDIILGQDGQPTNHLAQLYTCLSRLSPGSRFSWRIRRHDLTGNVSEWTVMLSLPVMHGRTRQPRPAGLPPSKQYRSHSGLLPEDPGFVDHYAEAVRAHVPVPRHVPTETELWDTRVIREQPVVVQQVVTQPEQVTVVGPPSVVVKQSATRPVSVVRQGACSQSCPAPCPSPRRTVTYPVAKCPPRAAPACPPSAPSSARGSVVRTVVTRANPRCPPPGCPRPDVEYVPATEAHIEEVRARTARKYSGSPSCPSPCGSNTMHFPMGASLPLGPSAVPAPATIAASAGYGYGYGSAAPQFPAPFPPAPQSQPQYLSSYTPGPAGAPLPSPYMPSQPAPDLWASAPAFSTAQFPNFTAGAPAPAFSTAQFPGFTAGAPAPAFSTAQFPGFTAGAPAPAFSTGFPTFPTGPTAPAAPCNCSA